MRWWLCVGVLVCAGVCEGVTGGSLRGALEALQRRQRARASLSPARPRPGPYRLYSPAADLYDDEPYEFMDENVPENIPPKYIIKYLNDEIAPSNYGINKKKKKSNPKEEHKPSAFRERTNKHEEDERLEKLFAEREENKQNKEERSSESDRDAEYAMLLNKLWTKYKSHRPDNEQSSRDNLIRAFKEKKIQKRQYPDDDGWGPVAFKRKRSAKETDDDEDDYPVLEYPLRESDRYKYTTDDRQDPAEPNEDRDDYIAFEPLDDEKIELPTNGDDYSYDTLVKRFPVTKRSGSSYRSSDRKRSADTRTQKNFRTGTGTDPKVIRDLSKLFGDPADEFGKNHVKRSYKNEESHESQPPQIAAAPHEHAHNHNESHAHDDGSHEHQGRGAHGAHPPTVTGKEEEVVPEQQHQHPISLKKKSIDWSQYFGIDKRKKKSLAYRTETGGKFVKQYEDIFDRELGLGSHKKVKREFSNDKTIDESEFEINRASIAIRSEKKRNSEPRSESKLENIDRKLAGVESVILDEALQPSDEDLSSKEEQQLKDNMLSRLAAAYNLEKMRKALKDFKKTINSQRQAKEINPNAEKSKEKRIAVKKEKAELREEEMGADNALTEQFEGEQGAGHYVDGATEEPFSEGYMGGSGTHRVPLAPLQPFPHRAGSGECPVLQDVVARCRDIDLLAGDHAHIFLPLCTLHQICYLCGERAPTRCDLVFVSEADTACGGEARCGGAARAALMAMRELHESLADHADGECESCLADALRSAGAGVWTR